MFDHFGGSIIQVFEALDYGDAVSNQILHCDKIFRENFGFQTQIYTKYHHEMVKQHVKSLDQLECTEADIVFFHFSGYAEYAADYIASLKCTKILVYHNITPYQYFNVTQREYALCKKGREQLSRIVSDFHFYIGDSQFNINELIALGVEKSKTAVLPILVPALPISSQASHEIKKWLFVGRIVPNKKQDVLIDVFYEYIKYHKANHQLILVGRFSKEDVYYQQLVQKVKQYGLVDKVVFTGKISDASVLEHYKSADIFICASEHEGFCVPLIEAMHAQVPVIAMSATAISETIEGSAGLITEIKQFPEIINQVFCNENFKNSLIETQNKIVKKYNREAITEKLKNILSQMLPRPDEYKTISIAICTYNRADLLDRCLDYLQYQTVPNFEVIVVNGPSTDNTEQVLNKYKHKIKIGRVSERNLSKSRNIAIEMASGDIVAFIDDDALPYDNWVELLLKSYNSLPNTVVGVGGCTFYAGALDYQVQDNAVTKCFDIMPNIETKMMQNKKWFRSILGTNSSFKRESLISILGFDEQYDYFLDETDLCVRLQMEGYLTYYDKNIYLRHEFAQSANRSGKYNYNWFTIVKNTVYFILKFNPHNNFYKNFIIILNRLWQDRLYAFLEAYFHKEILLSDLMKYSHKVLSGLWQGIRDAKHPRQLRVLSEYSGEFVPYGVTQAQTAPSLHMVIISKEFGHFTHAGGIGTMYYHLASELLQMGWRVSVITPGNAEPYRRGCFTLYRIPVKAIISPDQKTPVFVNNINWAYTAAQKVRELHAEHKIDIIDTPLWDIEGYALAFIKPKIPFVVRLVTPFLKVKEINQLQVSELDSTLCVEAEKNLIQNADRVIAISQNIAKTIEQNYRIKPDHRWITQAIGISYWPRFDVNLGYNSWEGLNPLLKNIPANTFKVLFLGRLERRKGIDIFIEAAKHILSVRDDFYFIIAGKDSENWAGTIQHPQAIFLGEIPLELKDKLYAFSDVVVFPSRYESFGLVALEAFIHGKPVIASNSGGIPEVVQEGISGLLFDENNAEKLAELLIHLKNDQPLYEKLSRGAYQRVKTLSSRNMAKASVEVYETLT